MNHHFADTNIIPLPSIDWGGVDIRDVTLLELTTRDGIAGIGSAYTGVSQVRDALNRYQQNPASLHLADAKTTIAMSAIDIALWDIRGKEQNQSVIELLGGRKCDRILAYATVDLPITWKRCQGYFSPLTNTPDTGRAHSSSALC